MEQLPSPLDVLLKLVRGGQDEVRGLFSLNRICKRDDHSSLLTVYEAVGPEFLDSLLRTGLGVEITVGTSDQAFFLRQVILNIIAALCRVPEIASSEVMVSNIPLLLEVMQLGSDVLLRDEQEVVLKILFLVSTTSDDGVVKFYESGGMDVLPSQFSALRDGSQSLDLAVKLVQLIITKITVPKVILDCGPSKLPSVVAAMARQFAILHNALKFELLNLLTAILSSDFPAPLREALITTGNNNWPCYVRFGVIAILQKQGRSEKLQALILSESMMSLFGEGWLIDKSTLPGVVKSRPLRVLLVIKSAKHEVGLLLGEAASSSNITYTYIMRLKRQHLPTIFSLVEMAIKLISNLRSQGDTRMINGSYFSRAITFLDNIIHLAQRYLYAQEGFLRKKGDDLVASVRLIGRYFAEGHDPNAFREGVIVLLEYMLSIEGEDESGPFNDICFLLPMLCHITMTNDGCRALVLCGGHITVIRYLVEIIGTRNMAADGGSIMSACNIIMNTLNKLDVALDESTVTDLLLSMANWAEHSEKSSDIMMASSICALLFGYTSENDLLRHPEFRKNAYTSLLKLMLRSLTKCGVEEENEDSDLREIITLGYYRWSDKFPYIHDAVEWWRQGDLKFKTRF